MAVLSIIETYTFHDGGSEDTSLFIPSVHPQTGALEDAKLLRPQGRSSIEGSFDTATGQINFHESLFDSPFANLMAASYTGFAIPGNGFGGVLALAGTWQRVQFTITLDDSNPSAVNMEVTHGGWYADDHVKLVK